MIKKLKEIILLHLLNDSQSLNLEKNLLQYIPLFLYLIHFRVDRECNLTFCEITVHIFFHVNPFTMGKKSV